MQIRLIGEVDLVASDRSVGGDTFGGRQPRLAFAYLVLQRTRLVPREELADQLWPGTLPRTWATALRGIISRVRAVISEAGLDGTSALTTAGGCYRLELPAMVEVDVELAETLASRAEAAIAAGTPGEAMGAAKRAAAIADGVFLPGEDGIWVDGVRAQVRNVRVRGLEALSHAASLTGHPGTAVWAAEMAVAAEPFLESAYLQLIRAHAASGNRAEGLRTYERCRRLLVEELGVSPSPVTEAAYLELLGTEPPHASIAAPLLAIVAGGSPAERAAMARHITRRGGRLGADRTYLTADFSAGDDECGAAAAAVAAAIDVVRQLPTAAVAVHHGPIDFAYGGHIGVPAHEAIAVVRAADAGQVLITASALRVVQGQLPDAVSVVDLGEHRLADFLEPYRLHGLEVPGVTAADAVVRSLTTTPNNLPSRSGTFIDRVEECAEIASALRSAPITTLTGTGGVGKSRLALRVASGALDQFRDGVFFVELVGVAQPTLVARHVADALGAATGAADDLDAAAAAASGKRILLVLDNCDRVLDDACAVAERLAECATVRVLATSRQPLGARSERVLSVSPLGIPATSATTIDEVLAAPAVALLADRAASVRPGFRVTSAIAASVIDVCRRLDGLPLAIELAATRLRAMGIDDLRQRLDDRFSVVRADAISERHSTLRAMLDWSHDLLPHTEQVVFRRISVFPGTFALDAAEHVAAGTSLATQSVIDLVASLVDKSMLVLEDHDGSARFRMLETVREYALARLTAAGEDELARAAHLAWYEKFAAGADARLGGPDQTRWTARLADEHDNVRAALAWAVAHDCGLELAASMTRFWDMRSHFGEGRRWLDAVLALPSSATNSSARARALLFAGIFADIQGDVDVAERRLEEAHAAWRELDDPARTAETLTALGNVARVRGDLQRAKCLQEEALAIRSSLGDVVAIAGSRTNLGNVLWAAGDFAEALELYDLAASVFRSSGDSWKLAIVLGNIADVARRSGEMARARAAVEEKLALDRAVGSREGEAVALYHLAELAHEEGDLEEALQRFDEAGTMFLDLGATVEAEAALKSAADIRSGTDDDEPGRTAADAVPHESE